MTKHLPSNLKPVSLFYPCRFSARGPFHRYLGGIPVWRTASRPVQARQRTDALTGLRHGDPAHRCLSGILAWRSVLLTGFRHGDPAHRYFRGIPVWQDCLEPVSNRFLTDALAGLRHGNPSHRHLRAIPAWRTASRPVHDRQLTDALTGLRHGDPAHRCLSGILAWRRWLVDGHRHDDLAHKPLRGILAWRRGYPSGLWPVFGTATHPTGTSEAFPRGETVISPTSLRLVIFTEHANMPYTYL